MGKHFGNLQKLYGVTYYALSPYEVKPFVGMLKPGLMRTVRRFKESFIFTCYPIVAFYCIRSWANSENERMHRKHPEDYADEQ